MKRKNDDQPVTKRDLDEAMQIVKKGFDYTATKEELTGVKQEVGEVKKRLDQVERVQEKTLEIVLSYRCSPQRISRPHQSY